MISLRPRIVGALLVALSFGEPVSADLIGYWPLEGDANDQTSNELHSELFGDATYTEDVPEPLAGGMSLLLNTEFTLDGGVSEDEIELEDNFGYVDLGNPDLLNFGENDFTIAAWMKVPEALFQRGNIFSNGGDNSGGVRYVLAYLENGGQGVVLTTDDNTDKRQAEVPLGDFFVDDEQWHHVVGQRVGTELRVYVDGEFAADNLDVPDGYDLSGTDQRNAYIGVGVDSASGAFEKFFQGWVDDVAVWNEAISEEQILTVMSGDFSEWIGGGVEGDFDGDGMLGVADINLLVTESAAMTNNPDFDLTGDAVVDGDDVNRWIKDLGNSWVGDANFDGEFNSGDFVQVFTGGKFEQDVAANWSEGDWNGDGRFNSGDFVTAFTDGGFEKGPRAATQGVPEPNSVVLLLIGSLVLLRGSRR